MKRRLVLVAVVISLAGCAAALQKPAPDQNYGQPPVDVEPAVRRHFDLVLKDPESARYRIGRPVKAYANNGLVHGGGVAWAGYLVDVQVNAKNSFGGYTGFKPYMVLFRGEAVFRVLDGTAHPLVQRME